MKDWFAIERDGQLVGMFDESRTLATQEPLLQRAVYTVTDKPTLFAAADTALHHIISTFAEQRINPSHPQACEEEASQWLLEPGLDNPELQDLESLAFVTIDNRDSRDLDQALFLETLPNGYRLLYALSDAAYYVRPGTALFDEALQRGSTYYAPGMAAPMLPTSLSEGLVSLNPDVRRRALVFDISLDKQGNCCSASTYQARIRSRAKLSYPGVQAWLDQQDSGKAHPWDSLDYAPSLRLLPEIGMVRMALARERNVVEHNRREVQMSIDPEDSSSFLLTLRDRNDVERYNEQISLLCNMVGAQMLMQREKLTDDMQAVFRVHLPPVQERLSRLRETLAELCELHQLDSVWRWDGESTLSDYMQGLPDGQQWQSMRQVVERQVMLSNHASEFSAEPGPHHALGVDGYARFSSPMREIAGIFSHKELLETQGALTPESKAEDEALREQVIVAANASKKAQRKLEKSFQLHIIEQYLRDDLSLPAEQRTVRAATVMGMRGTRIYLSLQDLSLDIKLYADDLEQQYNCNYEISSTTATPDVGKAPLLRIGDSVNIRTEAWDEQRRRFLFRLV